jgi:hypothetical protein
LLLDIRDNLAGIGLVPAPIEVLGGERELDDEVSRKVCAAHQIGPLGLELHASTVEWSRVGPDQYGQIGPRLLAGAWFPLFSPHEHIKRSPFLMLEYPVSKQTNNSWITWRWLHLEFLSQKTA